MLTIDKKQSGVKIRRRMDELNLSVADVTDCLGIITVQTVYHWISGTSIPSLENLVNLSDILHCSIGDLIVTKERVL